MPASAPVRAFSLWLEERCHLIRRLEAAAREVLLTERREDRYRRLMLQKSLVLSALPEEAEDFVRALPDPLRLQVAQRLSAFQRSANTAMELDSVFFMSALLYPEAYKEGDPNDLESVAAQVAAWGESFSGP
jgi:hypothetical protein